MTEKRFAFLEDGYYDTPPILENGEELGYADVLDRLNELYEENEQLKQEIQSIYEIIEEYVHTHHAHSSMRMKKQIEKVMWNE